MKNLAENHPSWYIPQRQSPAAIFIMLMKTALTLLKATWPLLIITIINRKNDKILSTILFILVGFAIISLLLTFIRYLFFRFYVEDENFIIKTGWLQKKTLSVPMQNIHAVNLEQSVWQQLFNVTTITLDSSGSEKTEVKIDALQLDKAELLKQLLLSRSEINNDEKINTLTADKIPQKLSGRDLLKLSLTANHIKAFFILLGLSLNVLDDIKKLFNFDEAALIKTYSGTIINQSFFVAGIIFILITIASIITSIIRTIVKYYNFTIEDAGINWKIAFGLFTLQQKIIPFKKIQILSWKANWLRRKLDFWILHVQTIGHDETKGNQQIQIPVTTFKAVLGLVPAYQHSTVIKESDGLQIEPDYWKRKLLMIGVPLTVILFIVLYFWIGLSALLIIFLFVYAGWHYRSWYKNFRWLANEEGLQLYSGVWGRKFTLLTWKKVQQIQINQNLYQRAHNLATLHFITAGGNVELPYIKYATAKQLTDYALYEIESKYEEWM